MRIVVQDREAALLFRNGRYAGPLAAGEHWLWSVLDEIKVVRLRRTQWVQRAGIDVLSADRFPLRLSVAAICTVADAKTAYDTEYLVAAEYALTTATAQAAAAQPIDTLVIERAALAIAIGTLLADTVPGCVLSQVRIAAVTLPPEVRRLFTDLERAKREGEAALERARGEHAALRSLANAARLLRGNPELMNLRLLQAVNGAPRPATLVVGESAFSRLTPGELGSEGSK